MSKKGRGTLYGDGIEIGTLDDAVELLTELESISVEIAPKMARQVDIKKAVTQWAVEKRVDVVQLEEHNCYFRRVNRSNSMWVGTDDEMPDPKPKGAKSLKAITKDVEITIKGKKRSLWNFITKRVPDSEKIDEAVRRGFITDAKIGKAYIEKPQAPFLQRFQGTAE